MSDRQAARAKAENRQGPRDPRAEAQGSHGLFSQNREASQEALDGSVYGFREQFLEHAPVGISSVVAPRVLVQIPLKPLLGDGVVDATDSVLSQTEESLDGLSVDVSAHVDACGVVDAPMPVLPLKGGVPLVVVGEQHRVGDDMRGDCLSEERPSTIGDDLGDDATAPLDRSETMVCLL
jgi:hypothetical protein